ncbi:MAG: TetR/AcrR family transcriptional regulator [Polyangiaceae bacterium]
MSSAVRVPIEREEAPKKEAILTAALELFAERGFHGTAVPLIAEKAKVGAGTLYRYFPSKEAIVNALYRQEKLALGHALLADFPVDAPTREVFHEIWVRLGRYAKEHPKSIAFLELHHHGDYLDASSKAVEMQMLLPIQVFVQDAQKKQILKDVPSEILMACVWGAFVGLVSANWKGFLEITPEALAQAEACMWEAIRR